MYNIPVSFLMYTPAGHDAEWNKRKIYMNAIITYLILECNRKDSERKNLDYKQNNFPISLCSIRAYAMGVFQSVSRIYAG